MRRLIIAFLRWYTHRPRTTTASVVHTHALEQELGIGLEFTEPQEPGWTIQKARRALAPFPAALPWADSVLAQVTIEQFSGMTIEQFKRERRGMSWRG